MFAVTSTMLRALWTRRVEPCASRISRSHTSAFSCSAKVRGTPTPWFVDESDDQRRRAPLSLPADSNAANTAVPQQQGLHENLPDCLVKLHAELCKSPILERESVMINPPFPTEEGPPLPLMKPRGRRRRGGTELGVGVPDDGISQWRWIVLAQVKEGTETRGAVESVMRLVRKTLLKVDPPVALPPNTKRRMQDGWGMLDAGDFAVHVVSSAAREKYFPSGARSWQW